MDVVGLDIIIVAPCACAAVTASGLAGGTTVHEIA